MQNRRHNSDMNSPRDAGARDALAGIDDALASLERRMNRLSAKAQPASRQQKPLERPAADTFRDDLSDILRRQRSLDQETRRRGATLEPERQEPLRQRESRRPEPAPRTVEKEQVASFSAGQVAVARELAAMRAEIARLRDASAQDRSGQIAERIDRLTHDMQRMATHRQQPGEYAALKRDIADLKATVEEASRAESVRELTDRWQVLERHLEETGAQSRSLAQSTDERLARLADHVEAMRATFEDDDRDPGYGALDERLKSLGDAMDILTSRREVVSPESIFQIEERLDEISRALIALSVSAAPAPYDATPLERIEARIGSLTSQIEDLSAGRREEEFANRVEERLFSLARQIEDLAADRAGADISGLESRLANIALQIEHLAEDRHTVEPSAIEARLEELSRQIGFLVEDRDNDLAPGLDMRLANLAAQIERLADDREVDDLSGVEARLSELAQRLEFLAVDRGNAAALDIEPRLVELSRQIETLAESRDAPDLARLEARLVAMAQQVDLLSDQRTDPALEDRIAEIHARLDQMPVAPAGQDESLLRVVDHMNDLAERLDGISGAGGFDAAPFIDSLDARFSELAGLLDNRQNSASESTARLILNLEDKITDLARKVEMAERGVESSGAYEAIEQRLIQIAHRLDETGLSPMEGGRADAIAAIEAQIAELARRIGADSAAPLDFLEPRFDAIESRLIESRDYAVEAARRAVEDVISSGMHVGAPLHGEASGLAEELRGLEDLARASDARNAKTFSAIHDTLLKVVDKLAGLEAGMRDHPAAAANSVKAHAAGAHAHAFAPAPVPVPAPAAPLRMPAAETPPLDLAEDGPEAGEPLVHATLGRETRSPAQAAAAAALAAISAQEDATPVASEAEAGNSVFSGLSKALKLKKQPAQAGPSASANAQTEEAPPVMVDGDDHPLEPGAGAPDLSSIMKRVREERKRTGGEAGAAEGEAGNRDFLNTVRRRAQAAAAEADILKGDSKPKSGRAGSLAALFTRHKKPVLAGVGVVLLAATAIPAAQMFLGGAEPRQDVAAVVAPPAAEIAGGEEPVALEASATDAGESGGEDANVRQVTMASDNGAAPADADAGSETTAALPEATAPTAETPALAMEAPAPAAMPPAEAGPIALREAAAAGDATALYFVGDRYFEGVGVKANYDEAAKWYRQSAEAGFAPAQYRLGNMYEKGFGVEANINEAKTWYQLAAEQGNASAMHNLGVLFAMGNEGAPDNESAVAWFRKAAEYGVRDSQYNLGILTAKGVGTPQDVEESYKWFSLVAQNGDKDAAGKRDEVAKAMRPEQLEKARADVKLWKPLPLDQAANAPELPAKWQASGEQTASVDMKKAVRNIQLILNKNGYDAGPADGVMGAKTKNAISAFQKANGLPVTGDVSPALVEALLKLNKG